MNTVNRVLPDEAGKILGVNGQFVRVALQRGLLDIGFAMKQSSSRYTYYINLHKLADYAGRAEEDVAREIKRIRENKEK